MLLAKSCLLLIRSFYEGIKFCTKTFFFFCIRIFYLFFLYSSIISHLWKVTKFNWQNQINGIINYVKRASKLFGRCEKWSLTGGCLHKYFSSNFILTLSDLNFFSGWKWGLGCSSLFPINPRQIKRYCYLPRTFRL